MNDDKFVEVKNLKKVYDNGHEAIKDVSFSVKKGDLVCLLGPSGCGKTTILNMLAGLLNPTSGDILFDGKSVVNVAPKDRQIGYVFQNYALYPHMTVLQNVMFPLTVGKQKMPKDKAKEIAEKYMETTQITELADQKPGNLSGGQQQRVALARALVAEPGLLLLDEPLSNLDAKLRESMRFEILEIQKKTGITVVYVTHDQGEAMAMSDRVVVMSMGVVQQIGAPHEIYTQPANKMVADFIGLVNFMEGEAKGDRVFLKGSNISFPNTSKVTGEATIAVRPENITMSLDGGQIEGQLTHRFYLGDAVDYRVKVGDHDVRVIVKGADLNSIPDGAKVYLDFDRVMVFEK